MTIINLYTSDQELFTSQRPKLASGNQGTVKIAVDFDKAWDGYARSGVFYTEKNSAVFESVMVADECTIPQEVLTDAGFLFIGVRGVKDGSVKTSLMVRYRIGKGADGQFVYEPTPGVYNQLVAAVGALDAKFNNFAKLTNGSTTGDAELMGIRLGADNVEYPTAGDAVREQFKSMYLYPFIVLHGTSLVNFDTINKSVTVPTFRAIGKSGALDIENTTLTFATNNGINVVYFRNGALGICMTSEIEKTMQPIFSFNSVSIPKFVGCSLPVANYSVDGKTFFEYRDGIAKRYYNNGFLSVKKNPVAFDTANRTVTIYQDLRLQGAKQYAVNSFNDVILPWDETGSATNYVFLRGGTEPVCSSTLPTADDVYLFAFFKGKGYLDGRHGCTLPAHLYTVDGHAFVEDKIINLDADTNEPITITENTKIYGNGHELNLGTILTGTRTGNIVKVEFTPAENSHFYNAFVSRTEGLTIESSRPYYNVTIWAFNGNKYEAIRLTPYLTIAEVNANDNSFTYADGIITINSASYTDFVLASEKSYGIAVTENVKVEIHDLKILFARGDCVDVNAGHISLYNCEFGYSTTANGIAVQNADCNTIACKAYYNRNDGFNYHYSGHSTLIECEGYNNFDDGVSHHEDCTFEINGGVWMNNGKGGVASPTYGAKGRISNVICVNNYYGIYADAEESQSELVFINGAAIKGNVRGIHCNNYKLQVFNSRLAENQNPNLEAGDGTITMV